MTIQELVELYGHGPQVEALRKAIEEKSVKTIFLEGLVASSAPMLFAALEGQRSKVEGQRSKVEGQRSKDKGQRSKVEGQRLIFNFQLIILSDEEEAGYFYHDLKQMLGMERVLFFPSSYRRSIKYAQRDPANEILRTEVLTFLNGQRSKVEGQRSKVEGQRSKVEGQRSKVEGQRSALDLSPQSLGLSIVTYPEALAEQVVSQEQLNERTLVLEQGQTVSVEEITTTLHDFGFQEVDYVYEPGQYALRGSILDVYSFSSEYPFRIDFFGDDIDSIRTFEVEDQLSRDRKSQISIVPELSKDEGQRSKVKGQRTKDEGQRTKDEGQRSKDEGQFSIFNFQFSIFNYLPEGTLVVAKDLQYVHDAIDRTYQETGDTVPLIDGNQFMEAIASYKKIEFGHRPMEKPDATLTFHTTLQPLFHKNFDLLRESFSDFQSKGYHLYVLADSKKQLQRLEEILSENSENSENSEHSEHSEHSENSTLNYQLSTINYITTALHAGFVDHDLQLCVFTDHEIFDRFHKYTLRSDKARSGKVALTLKEIRQFEVGDYVVHVDHGIGKFGGLVRMPITQSSQSSQSSPNTQSSPSYQEMIKIIYQGGGAIYVSIHSLYKVSKYKAQDNGEPPRLSQLGTGQWERMKERTKSKIKDIARDLIKLYAARRKEKGFAFSADSFMQHELEASFLYEDTPDQLKATNEVKADMEQARPMDRLVCGDVGFGKTEVAVRAAFKAACDSKQVAVLVPTTVLAYQHYQTFKERLKNFPVRVDYLTRARSAKQTKELLQDLADGKIDIIIGTHRLIGKTVKFKDLGLLIIDEEQKFGVSTKEKLRQMKTSVDTLTLTATPIPRTLQFSLLGARDLSIIQTPPPNRYPIHTEIHTFGPEIIRRIADMIHRYVPEARIAIGHGQMKPDELEQVVYDFINYDYDVLLSTTIIENGIDIPNANTIIINGAHHFGLSDLHQMRGRVGRSNRKAFCYLLAPPLADLPQESRRRLEALENFSDLGSGIQIAMQDLDIRGAGNLLGAEQSGFIADLGYETYQKILNEAVKEIASEFSEYSENSEYSEQFVSEASVDTDLALYFPDQYVPSDSERMLLYRELDNLHTDEQLAAYRSRLIDRFGPVPQVGEELMRVVPLRRLGQQLGCEKIMLKQGRMTLFFVSNPDSPFYQSPAFDAILSFVAQNPRRCQFRDLHNKRSLLLSDIPSVESALSLLQSIKWE